MRALTLVTASIAAGIVAVAAFRPDWLDGIGERIRAELVRVHVQQWADLSATMATNPAAAAVRARELAAELRAVRKLDRLAPLLRLVEGARFGMAMQRGDVDEALASATRLVEFDDLDVDAAIDLSEVLARIPGRSAAARAALERVRAVTSTHPRAVPLLCRLQLESGDTAAVAHTLATARTIGTGGPWRVHWGSDPRQGSWFDWFEHDGEVAATFTLVGSGGRLRLEPPAWAALGLRSPTLTVADADHPAPRRIDFRLGELTGMHWMDDLLVVDGDAAARVDLEIGGDERPVTVTLRARLEALPPPWMRALLLGAPGAAALGVAEGAERQTLISLRIAAFSACAFCLRPLDGSRTTGHSKPTRLSCSTNAFSAAAAIETETRALEIELPRDTKLTYGALDAAAGGIRGELLPVRDIVVTPAGWQVVGPSPLIRCNWATAVAAGTICVLDGVWQ